MNGDKIENATRTDKPIKNDSVHKGEDGAVGDWNRQAGTAKERSLSPEERDERARVAIPVDGVGCRYNSPHPVEGAVTRLLASFSPEKLKALENPNNKVILTAMASRPGAAEYNQRLSEQRGQNLKRDLLALGVKAQIEVEALGERPAADRGASNERDNHEDRVVLMNIVESGKETGGKSSSREGAKGFERPAQKTAVGVADRPLGQDMTRSVSRLEDAIGVPDGAPDWLQPKAIELKDGSKGRLSTAEAGKVRDIVQKENLGSRPFDKPRRIGDVLLLRNPESNVARYTTVGEIPQGPSIQNKNFVFREDNRIEAKPLYPESPQAVARDIRQRSGQSLIDVFGESKPDKGQIEKEVAANKQLNGWTKDYLQQGCSLEKAIHLTSERALNELKIKIVDLVLPVVFSPVSSGRPPGL